MLLPTNGSIYFLELFPVRTIAYIKKDISENYWGTDRVTASNSSVKSGNAGSVKFFFCKLSFSVARYLIARRIYFGVCGFDFMDFQQLLGSALLK